MPSENRLLDRLVERRLAVGALAKKDEEGRQYLLEASSLFWGVGPRVGKGDLVIIYVPSGVAKRVGGRWGLRFVFAVEARSTPVGSEYGWNQLASLRDKVELGQPIARELREDPVLKGWDQARVYFHNSGRRDAFVPEGVARALWELVLERNPSAHRALESLLDSNPFELAPEWTWFSASARSALNRANGLRSALGSSKVHTEHLLLAAYDGAGETVRGALERAGVPRDRLVSEIAAIDEPPNYRELEEEGTPPLSGHAARALQGAALLAEEYGSPQIELIHIWHGLLALGDDCSVIARLPPVKLPPVPRDQFVVGTRALRDTWTEQDLLDYTRYTQAIAEPILLGYTRPPLTIGIQAPWGHGKTSLMRMIQERLDPGALKREEAWAEASRRPVLATFKKLLRWLESDDPPAAEERSAAGSEPTLVDAYGGFLRCEDGSPRKPGLLGTTVKDPRTGAMRPRVPTVWFNPLYYQEKEQVWAGMAHAMLQQLSGQVEDPLLREWFWARLQASRISEEAMRRALRKLVLTKVVPNLAFWGLLGSVVFLVLVVWWHNAMGSLGAGLLASLLATTIDLVAKRKRAFEQSLGELGGSFEACVREPDYESRLGFLWLVDRDMDRAMDLLLGDFPVAVFIDDLDRCDPQIVNKLILAVNQFLSLRHRNSIFFLGMDMEMVAASLEEVRSGVVKADPAEATQGKSFGWKFMDKFVQLPFFIPRMDPPQARAYLEEILGGGKLASAADVTSSELQEPPEGETATEEEIAADLEEIRRSETVEDLSKTIAKKLEKGLDREQEQRLREAGSSRTTELMRDPQGDEIRRLVELALQDVEPNPRAMKRLLNLVRLLRNVQVARGQGGNGEFDRKLVVRSAHLLITWPRIVRWLQTLELEKSDQLPRSIEALETAAREAADLKAWQEKTRKEIAGDGSNRGSSPWLDPAFYRFVKQIGQDPPGLSQIFKARLF